MEFVVSIIAIALMLIGAFGVDIIEKTIRQGNYVFHNGCRFFTCCGAI